jgi:hypothetical protein
MIGLQMDELLTAYEAVRAYVESKTAPTITRPKVVIDENYYLQIVYD